ncbi:MAG: aspartyl protease family protein [Vulcanisaeta sp.]
MGHVRVRAGLYFNGRSLEVDALVDTGAPMVVLPRAVAEGLRIRELGKVRVELADGSVGDVPYGPLELEVVGRRAPVFAAIVEGGEVCIGVEALERLGLAVDPVTGNVYPTRRFVTRI